MADATAGPAPPTNGRHPDSAAARLADFALAHGTPFAGGGNRPVRLDDPDALWFVARGSVDVFVAREQDSGAIVEFKHLLRATRGRLLFQTDDGPNVLVAKGLPDSELRRVPRDTLLAADEGGAVVDQVDAWIADVSAAVALDVTHRQPTDCFLAAGAVADLEPGEVVSTKGGVVWMSGTDVGLAFLGTEEPDRTGSGFVPVAPDSWVSVSGPTRQRGAASRELHREGRLLPALAEFHRLALGADDLNRSLLLADAVNLRAAQTRYRRESEDAARRSLFDVVDAGDARPEARGAALQEALALIGRHEGIRFRTPAAPRGQQGAAAETGPSLDRILTASRVRGRDIALGARDRWWLGDSGAMLAFRREDGAPVALLPRPSGRYRMVDPASGRAEPVNAGRAASLRPNAIFFYQSLPDGRVSGVGALARIAFRRWRGDVFRFATAGLLAGLAMLAPAVLLGVFADEVAPAGRAGTLAWLTAGMLLLALTAGLLEVIEGTALMRLEGRAAARLTAALWDRLLDLPAVFFRNFTAGDLATRAMAFHDLRNHLSGVVMGALLSTVFLLPTFILLFLYDASVGWLGLAGGLASLTVTVTLGLRQMPHHRRLLAAERSLAGVLLQLIGAARKLRSTGKEWTAFTRWAHGYREQKRSEMNVGALNEHLVAFTAAAPLLATAALFAVALETGPGVLSTGAFLTVYAAYMVLMSAIAALGRCVSDVAAIVPAGEQVAPILETAPRGAAGDAPAPELRGEVRFDNVSFRYEDGPPVLRDVSIHVRPGEFVALVGGSGAGKSTVLRIALGLERPSSGVVYYDGHDLERVNRRAVRRQVGVVVQDGSLQPRTLRDNIIGLATDLTLDDAWRAARLAAVDGDIRAMPMGMLIVVTESSQVFSGGQIQRIMLAAALVRRPRVLLLDEATSFLDNKVQAQVMARIEQLAVTRIVVAHRLSTVRKADRIYVLDEGRVAQRGTFAELIETPGVFRDLALRQMA
ncbi:MAG: NHLP bacteriocin export ABC transporter permease/ATPase subunit [Acidobacteria bacterium]|nr:NHLP bacteriocin export ABC transporter permease/ATPase subunit [Acidobacteriota bacterium]